MWIHGAHSVLVKHKEMRMQAVTLPEPTTIFRRL